MATPLVVAGNTYLYPENDDNSPWGEEATSWAVAVTGVLGEVQGTGDIQQSVSTIANNISSPTNVIGLSFSPVAIRGAIIEYTVYRNTTGGGATEAAEVGTMYVCYKNIANSWELTVVGGGNAGVTFAITSAGQVTYTSTNFTGSSYSGICHFRARALLQ